jgi:hypothetical protein
MTKLSGIKYETDAHGEVKKVTFDMKYHANAINNYLDHLRIVKAKKDSNFVDWESIKAGLDKKHEIA